MNHIPHQTESATQNPESTFRSKLDKIKSMAWELEIKLIETISAKQAKKLSAKIKQELK